jgi:prepilin-type N-terminal cleavage/methylation domain-containing protein
MSLQATRREWQDRTGGPAASDTRRGWASHHRHPGMTLLEVVLAMSLLVVLSSMTFWFYGESLKTRDAGLRETRRLQLSRVLLERMATELKQVVSTTSFRDVSLLGDAERIWFSTVRLPGREFSRERLLAVMDVGQEEKDRFREFDQVKIEYKIARHPEIKHDDGYELPLGMARVELTVPRKDSAETGKAFEEQDMAGPKEYGTEEEESEVPEEEPVDDASFIDSLDQQDELEVEDEIHFQELYAPEIRFLRFCYYDGNKWWDKWDVGGENPLPQLIQVTIGYEPQTPFGQEFQMEEEIEEFCTCMNEDPIDCELLPGDQYTIVVRLEQADLFFRSRVARESKAFIDNLGM